MQQTPAAVASPPTPPMPSVALPPSLTPQPPMDRFLVLSLLEDLQFPPPAEDPLFPADNATLKGRDGKQTKYDDLFVGSPTGGLGGGGGGGGGGATSVDQSTSSSSIAGDTRDAGLLTAGENTDGVEEPLERQLARVRAVAHLPALARKMGPRWTAAELVPYLLRCCEDDTEALAFAVAKVLPSLLGINSIAIPPPPVTVVGGGDDATTEASQGSADALTPSGAADGHSSSYSPPSSQYSFASRSTKALEASLAVTGASIREAIHNTHYHEHHPSLTASSSSASSPPPPPMVNVPSQHVVTPAVLAPVLLALASVRSRHVRRFVADVTIPTVCFGVPFALHTPLFEGAVGAGGCGDSTASSSSYSVMGAGKGALPMPSPILGGGSIEEGAAMGLGLPNHHHHGGEGSSSSSSPSQPSTDFDDAYFYELLRLSGAISATATPPLSSSPLPEGGGGATATLSNLVDEFCSLASTWQTDKTARQEKAALALSLSASSSVVGGGSGEGGEGEEYSSSPSLSSASASLLNSGDVFHPFLNMHRRSQLHAAIKGAMLRQKLLFGGGGEGEDEEGGSENSKKGSSSSSNGAVDPAFWEGSTDVDGSSAGGGGGGGGGIRLFNSILRELCMRSSSLTSTSMFSSINNASSANTASTTAPYPHHLAMGIRLVSNVLKVVTACSVEHVKEASLLLARGGLLMMASGANTTATVDDEKGGEKEDGPAASHSPSPLLFPPATSAALYTGFEERAVIAAYFQQTVPMKELIKGIETVIANAVFEARGGGGGGGDALNSNSSAHASRTNSNVGHHHAPFLNSNDYAAAAAANQFFAESEDFHISNPFVTSSSSSSSSSPSPSSTATSSSSSSLPFSSSKMRFKYPLHVMGIEEALASLIPTLALKEHSKAVERVVGMLSNAVNAVVGAVGGEARQRGATAAQSAKAANVNAAGVVASAVGSVGGYCSVPWLDLMIDLSSTSSSSSHVTQQQLHADPMTMGTMGNWGLRHNGNTPQQQQQRDVLFLSRIDHLLLSASDVSSILFEVMSMPIPTVGGSLHALATTAKANNNGQQAASASSMAMGGFNYPTSSSLSSSSSSSTRYSSSVLQLLSAAVMGGAGGGGGSVSRQPSIVDGGGGGGGKGRGATHQRHHQQQQQQHREPKTMFTAVSSARTSHGSIDQLFSAQSSPLASTATAQQQQGRGSGASSLPAASSSSSSPLSTVTSGTPFSIPTTPNASGGSGVGENSSLLLQERLSLLRSRSFGGHYFTITARASMCFVVCARRFAFLTHVVLVVLSAVQQVGNPSAMVAARDASGERTVPICLPPPAAPSQQQQHFQLYTKQQSILLLLTLKNSMKQFSAYFLAARCAIIQPVGKYLSWRSRLAGVLWLPSVVASLAQLAERLAVLSISMLPIILPSSSSPSSPLSSSTSAAAELSLQKDALLLWNAKTTSWAVCQEGREGGAGDGNKRKKVIAFSSSFSPKVYLSVDDFQRMADLFTNHLWPSLRRNHATALNTVRSLIVSDVEDEVRVAALTLLLSSSLTASSSTALLPVPAARLYLLTPFTGGSSAGGSSSASSPSSTLLVPSIASSIFNMTAPLVPLAALRDALADATTERRRHTNHRTAANNNNTASSPFGSLLPPMGLLPWHQSVSFEVLEIVKRVLKGGGEGRVGGDLVVVLPPNVSERTRAAVPVGLTHLLRAAWAVAYQQAGYYCTQGQSASCAAHSARVGKTDGQSPIALYAIVGTSSSSSASPSMTLVNAAVSPANEEDLRYVYHTLTESSQRQVGMGGGGGSGSSSGGGAPSILVSDYAAFREACSNVLASLAQDKGSLVQMSIVSAMLQLLSSSASSSSCLDHASASGGGGEGAALMSPNTASVVSAAHQPTTLGRAEMEVFVSEMCQQLVLSTVWRVREAFAVTLAKTIVAYAVPAVLLGVDTLKRMGQQSNNNGKSSSSSSLSSWSLADALFYEKVFAEVLGLAAPHESVGGGGGGGGTRERAVFSSSSSPSPTCTSPLLLLDNYNFAVAELIPMFVSLCFDRTKAVRDAAADSTACMAYTMRHAAEVFDKFMMSAGGGGPSSLSSMNTLRNVEIFINQTFFTDTIVNNPRPDTVTQQHSYLMRAQLLTMAVIAGVSKKILLPLLEQMCSDSIVNVRMMAARAIGALVSKQREVEGDSFVAINKVKKQEAADGGGSEEDSGAGGASMLPSSASSAHSVIRRSLLPINPNVGSAGNSKNATKEISASTASAATAAQQSSSSSPHPSLIVINCSYYHFTAQEREDVLCSSLLRPLLEDSSVDARDVASEAFAVCY